MPIKFSENQVHQHIYERGLEKLTEDTLESATIDGVHIGTMNEFELWRVIKFKTLDKLERLHRTIRYGEFIGSKVKLPIDNTKPMELDFLGQHEDGLFVLELKINRSAERNAFSELFAYSNYIAGIFALSGHKDISNVLIATLDAKITQQAFIYDLLIADRNIIVYTPTFPDGKLESLRLELYIPTDENFRHFANQLLLHKAMSCAVASFHDMEGWIDSGERGEDPPDYTVEHLNFLSSYTAQLMEAERLHGFCFTRKPWPEMTLYYSNSLVICALNPYKLVDAERSNAIIAQLDEKHHGAFSELPMLGFDGRLASVAQRALKDCFTNAYRCELDFPLWSAMVTSSREVVYTHNFGFRPTGIMRHAYVSHLTSMYDQNQRINDQGLSTLKLLEISNWLRAWQFMEMCGFVGTEENEPDGDDKARFV